MQTSNYPSPPLSDLEIMDRGHRLPPITTQLADLFPKQRPNTPPISPEELRSGHPTSSSSMKRKRSDQDLSADEASSHSQSQSKRPVHDWRMDRPVNATSTSARPSTLGERPASARPVAQSPAHRISESSSARSPQSASQVVGGAHSERQYPTLSPQSAPATAPIKAPSDSYFRPQPYPTLSAARPLSSDSVTGPAAQHMSQTRVLPPLINPHSPQSAQDRKYSLGNGKIPLPPLEPAAYGQTGSSKYSYGPYSSGSTGSLVPSRHSSVADLSQHTPSDARQHRAPSHPQPLHPAFEPRAERAPVFDPVRPQLTNPWRAGEASTQSHRALPPMPGLTDPIPPPPMASVAHGDTSPNHPRTASHSLDRYRFDAPPTSDHPARRRRGNLPKEATARLNEWFAQHHQYPYPKEDEKQALQQQTGLTMSQIGNWFINARRRRRPSATSRPLEGPPGPAPPPHVAAGMPPHYAPHERAPPPPPQYEYGSRLPPFGR